MNWTIYPDSLLKLLYRTLNALGILTHWQFAICAELIIRQAERDELEEQARACRVNCGMRGDA